MRSRFAKQVVAGGLVAGAAGAVGCVLVVGASDHGATPTLLAVALGGPALVYASWAMTLVRTPTEAPAPGSATSVGDVTGALVGATDACDTVFPTSAAVASKVGRRVEASYLATLPPRSFDVDEDLVESLRPRFARGRVRPSEPLPKAAGDGT